jgi:hypothetical protein
LVLSTLACSLFSTVEPTSNKAPATPGNPRPSEVPTLPQEPVPTTNIETENQAVPLPTAPPLALCTDPQPAWVTGFNVYQAPEMAEPAPRQAFRDPVFGACLVRVTDRFHDLSVDDPSEGLKNEYSRVQSFNVDESLILVRGIAATWYLYDAHSLEPVEQIPVEIDPRWDSSNPDLLYYGNETRLMAYNVASHESWVVHEFAADLPGQSLAAVWTRYEGSPSMDSRYWGMMAQNQDWETVGFLVYDLVDDRVIATRQISPASIDSVTISPKGDYFLAYFDYCEQGQPGSDEHPCGLMVYNRDLSAGRNLLRLAGHSDLALDSEGHEVLVYQDIDTDNIAMLDLASGQSTPLWPIDFSFTPIGLHISGQAFARPGWAAISTHDGDTVSHTWMDDQVFLIELKPEGKVVRLAHTYSLVDENQEHDYWAEPQASANRDLTRILFTSNWGRSGTGQVEMYLIQLPKDWSGE